MSDVTSEKTQPQFKLKERPGKIEARIQAISQSMATHFFGGLGAVTILCTGLLIGHSSAQANSPYAPKVTNGRKVLPRDISQMTFQELSVALSNFKNVCGSFPTTAQGLKALVAKPESLSCMSYPKAGFVKDAALKDRWGNPFQYTSDGQHYHLTTLGADGKPGGTGDDQDATVTD